MSNPTAVSILAKLTSWYTCNGNLNDSHGSNHLVLGVSASYEAGGKVSGQRLAAGSRAKCTLADSLPISATEGIFFIGGWVYYPGASVPDKGEFGLSRDVANNNESLVIDSSGGTFAVFGWGASPPAGYNATDPNTAGVAYDFTARVLDSNGRAATSAQQIVIRDPSDDYPEGWYFVVGQYDEGVPMLWVHGVLVDTGTPAADVNGSPITQFQVGNPNVPEVTQGALSELFFGSGELLTQTEIDYLYNDGNARTRAAIVSDAA